MRTILIIFLLFPIAGNTQLIDLSQHNYNQNTGRNLSYYEDRSGALSLIDIQSAYKNGLFKKGTTDILNFGNSPSAIWIHCAFKSTVDSAEFLIIDAASLEKIDCFMPGDTGWQLLQAGSTRKPSPGVISTNHYIFPIPKTVNNGINRTIWIRIQTRNIMLVPLKLATANGLLHLENSTAKTVEASLVGAFLILFAFHLFLFFGIGDRSYLYYCLYIVCFGLYILGYLGGYIYFLGTDARILFNKYPHVFLCLALIASILITNKVYQLKIITKRLFIVAHTLLIAAICLLVISLLGLKAVAATGSQILGLVIPLTLLACGVIIAKKSKEPTAYFTVAWLAIITAAVFYVLSLEGILEYRSYSRLILEAGVMVEFLLLAFALGKRYHAILDNQRKIEAENYQLAKDQNEKLERLVEQRTQLLKNTISKLETSDNIKNTMFSIVAHDLRTPFNSILGLFSSHVMDELSRDELKLIIDESKDNFYHLKNLLDNLLHWARLQMNEVQTHSTHFDLAKVTTELVATYRTIAQQKALSFEIIAPTSFTLVNADRNHILLVLRNLFDNAIKFSPPQNSICIILSDKISHIQFSIENKTPPGTNSQTNQPVNDRPFTSNYGTANEKGVGLGLALCKDYLKKNGSSLNITYFEASVLFSFELPAATI
ncbi:sensor histidine kinase [Niabella sp. CC-SYL272]|uniref:sensor histidine kinase n=1 Tax=Niabella agricola TaxID=2891571 RepID=UPI001F188135|nr:sensor histidine kinase [Niabella agricola]MCF3107741.1 sensor histidine kinase [Niabella agricola]